MNIDNIKGFLARAKQKNKIANAYIIYGGDKTERNRLAVFLSSLLNCRENLPCMECRSCKHISRGVHPDVKWIIPTKSVLAIDDVRAVKENIYLAPYEGNKKIYIFDIDYMRDESANALLKILEEPPPYSVLVILSSNISFFLPTIVSRCQKLRLNYRLPDNGDGFIPAQNEFVLMLKQARAEKFFEFCRSVDAFVKSNEREDVEKWLSSAVFIYRDIFLSKYKVAKNLRLETGAGMEICEDVNDSIKAMEYLLEIKDRVKYNINLRLGLENLFLQVAQLK